jgi:hypothetical protein
MKPHAAASAQDQLTNEFLGITSGNDDSDVEEEAGASLQASRDVSLDLGGRRGRDPSNSFDSFHSTAEHVYHRSDSHELRRIIKEREDQVRCFVYDCPASFL